MEIEGRMLCKCNLQQLKMLKNTQAFFIALCFQLQICNAREHRPTLKDGKILTLNFYKR